MTDDARNLMLGIGVVLILLVAACELRAQGNPRVYDEQLLNYRFSEFCSVVGKPSQLLAEAINGAIAQNPADPKWRREADWFNRIVEHYHKVRCGET